FWILFLLHTSVVSLLTILSFSSSLALFYLLSFPTRRSSDLQPPAHRHRGDRLRHLRLPGRGSRNRCHAGSLGRSAAGGPGLGPRDRKSTRLNSSHVAISYADFCLKKKKE